jgi:hypothetical protein
MVTLALHSGKIAPAGTLKAILDATGLTADELRDTSSEVTCDAILSFWNGIRRRKPTR